MATSPAFFDLLIVGAGLSGIGAAVYFRKAFPQGRLAVLEGRSRVGGTWDLFTYPGIRSDSDMQTFAFSFKPWTDAKNSIAAGELIREYIRTVAEEYKVTEAIKFNHKVKAASWRNAQAHWVVQAVKDEKVAVQYHARFVLVAAGYYDYEEAYTPEWSTLANFKGQTIHPQFWPQDYDYINKKVVVIGSGATAVTLVPAMAPKAEHVTMLQRSPTWLVAFPKADPFSSLCQRFLPSWWGAKAAWLGNVLYGLGTYNLAKKAPEFVKKVMHTRLWAFEKVTSEELKQHFTPTYNPWDQRVCVVADGDLFKELHKGKVDIVTDHIDQFEAGGIKLKSGKFLEADTIITATGLKLRFAGGIKFDVDGKEADPAKLLLYKGAMLSDVPNLAQAIGYTNASWTLKVEHIFAFVMKVLKHMEQTGATKVVPIRNSAKSSELPFFDLQSGYIKRLEHLLPRQGTEEPWMCHQNYRKDLINLSWGSPVDGVLAYTNPLAK